MLLCVIICGMFARPGILLIGFVLALSGCAGEGTTTNVTNVPVNSNINTSANTNTTSPRADTTTPSATPSNQITQADVAKLKWLEGTWRGMDGEKPFYERIRIDGTTMVVESFSDGALEKLTDTARFELKDGEFGNTVGESRSAASSITETSVQFVPDSVTRTDGTQAPVKGNTFRFEKQNDGTWSAILDTPAAKDKPAGQKTYKMEPWKPAAK
jgi:hypothetical protein